MKTSSDLFTENFLAQGPLVDREIAETMPGHAKDIQTNHAGRRRFSLRF